MICDLALADSPVVLHADIALIGGGTVGLVIADRLARKGLRTVVLESGSRQQTANANALNEVECTEQDYGGAQEGRARGLGGTSQIWGGALIPFLPLEFDARPELGLSAWPVDAHTLKPYITEIEQLFRVVPDGYEPRTEYDTPKYPSDDDFIPRLAKWPNFSRRNLANLLAKPLNARQTPQIWLNATVVDFHLTEDDMQLESVVAVADGGKQLQLSAKKFVLCAGAIESTRLMLCLQRKAQRTDRFSPSLGRYFHDHVSEIVGQIESSDQAAVNKLFGFTFQKATMRSLRYELSPATRRAQALPGSFCHVSFKPIHESGVDQLRMLLRNVQLGQLSIQQMAGLWRSTPYFVKMAYWLAIHRQLYWPDPSILSLHVVVEQLPRATNHMTLADRSDRFGLPKARLHWSIDPADLQAIDRITERFGQFWAQGALSRLGRLMPYKPVDPEERRALSTDIYHPGGSTRMGRQPHDAVVDADLRVWGMSNLSIAATSTFPTGGAANPTMTLLLFGLRLADRLSTELAQSSQEVKTN